MNKIELLSVIRHMIEQQLNSYEEARDGSLKQWDSNYKTNEYKRRGLEEFYQKFYNKFIEDMMREIYELK